MRSFGSHALFFLREKKYIPNCSWAVKCALCLCHWHDSLGDIDHIVYLSRENICWIPAESASPWAFDNRMKILVADDHPLFLEAIKMVVSSLDGGGCIVEARDYQETFNLLERHPDCDLLLLDLGMPGMDGLDGLRLLLARFSTLPVAVITASEDPARAREVMALGAKAFIPKSQSKDLILGVLRLVLAGGVYAPPELLTQKKHACPESGTGLNKTQNKIASGDNVPLSDRQMEILQLLCKGKTNKEMGLTLGISSGTVKIHVAAVFRALKVRNRTQAVILARDMGLKTD